MNTAHVKKVLKKSAEVKALWLRACKHENMDGNSMFVVWSPNNPHVADYYKAMREYQELISTN